MLSCSLAKHFTHSSQKDQTSVSSCWIQLPIWKTEEQENMLDYAENMCACVLSHFSLVQFFETLWTVAHQAPLSMGFSGQEDWSGLPCPPPRDLPGPCLLHCRRILYCLSLQGSCSPVLPQIRPSSHMAPEW